VRLVAELLSEPLNGLINKRTFAALALVLRLINPLTNSKDAVPL
jgi:hypothetical protein